MKKTLLLIAFLFSIISIYAKGPTVTEVTKIYDESIYLSPSATTWTVAGSIVTTSTSFTVNNFAWDCDTLSFVAEIYGSESLTAGETDSIALDLRIIPVSPGGLTDSLAWATWTQVLHKSTIGGKACFGAGVTFTQSSHIYGRMMVLIGDKTGDAETVKLRIYRIRKWRSP